MMRLLSYIVFLAAVALLPARAADDSDPGDLAALEAKRLDKIIETIQVLKAKGDVAGMMALYEKGLAIAPADPSARGRYVIVGWQVAGQALGRQDEPAAEVLDLVAAIETYMGDEHKRPSMIWWLRAAALTKLGRAGEAEALKTKALEFKPDDATYHRLVGIGLRMAGLYTEAVVEFETGLAVATDDWVRGWITWGLALTYDRIEAYEEAADKYEEAVGHFEASHNPPGYDTLFEQASSALYNLGRYYELRGRHADTIAANERALKLMPAQLNETLGDIKAQHLQAIGDAYIELGEPNKALEALERARTLAPDVAGIYASLGDAHSKLKNDDEARKAYARCEALNRELIKRQPAYAMPYNDLAWFLATHDRDLDEALKLSKTSLDIQPGTPEHLDTLAEIYHRRGQHDAAIESITKALELDPKPAHFIYYEQQLEKFQKAKKAAR